MITINAYHPEGWLIQLEIEKDKIGKGVTWLNDNGYKPKPPGEFAVTPEGLPICPKHNVVMQKRNKQDDTWFSHNAGTAENKLYCKGYQAKSSPGYEVQMVKTGSGQRRARQEPEATKTEPPQVQPIAVVPEPPKPPVDKVTYNIRNTNQELFS